MRDTTRVKARSALAGTAAVLCPPVLVSARPGAEESGALRNLPRGGNSAADTTSFLYRTPREATQVAAGGFPQRARTGQAAAKARSGLGRAKG